MPEESRSGARDALGGLLQKGFDDRRAFDAMSEEEQGLHLEAQALRREGIEESERQRAYEFLALRRGPKYATRVLADIESRKILFTRELRIPLTFGEDFR